MLALLSNSTVHLSSVAVTEFSDSSIERIEALFEVGWVHGGGEGHARQVSGQDIFSLLYFQHPT